MDFEEFRLLGVEAQRKAFAELTKSEQYDVYRSFEEFHQPFVDGFYKDQLGQVMYREGTVEHDGYFLKNGKKIAVEEKYRTRDYNDLLIELIQDITYPMTAKNTGWFYQEKADVLVYVICQAERGKALFSANKPSKIYTVNLPMLRGNLSPLLSAGAQYGLSASKRGKGFTINMSVPWDILEMNGISKKYLV